MTEPLRSFIFLGDLLKSEIDQPVEITQGYTLKKADLGQIEIIDRNLNNLGCRYLFKDRYKMLFTKTSEGSFTGNLLQNQADWNYWIIEHDYIQASFNMQIALKLCKLDLNPLFEITYSEGFAGSLCNADYPTIIKDISTDYNYKVISSNGIEELRLLLSEVDNLINSIEDYNYIHKAFIDFDHIKELSIRNSFVFIGLYSIIESLITHNPERGADSITHQLRTKLNLLNNRFENKINHMEYFKGPDSTKFETIIQMLYSYRSDIAHGNFADFNKKLQLIADTKISYNFLYTLVKELLKYSLKDPQLIKDLKYC